MRGRGTDVPAPHDRQRLDSEGMSDYHDFSPTLHLTAGSRFGGVQAINLAARSTSGNLIVLVKSLKHASSGEASDCADVVKAQREYPARVRLDFRTEMGRLPCVGFPRQRRNSDSKPRPAISQPLFPRVARVFGGAAAQALCARR